MSVPLPFHRVRLWGYSRYPMPSHRARVRIIGVRILRALPRLSALVFAETYCASACGTSGCRNDGRGCATWCDAYRCRESAWALLAEIVATTHKEGVPCIKTGARPGQKDLPSATYPFGRGSETKLQVQTLPCGASATRFTRSRRCCPPRRDDVPFLMII